MGWNGRESTASMEAVAELSERELVIRTRLAGDGAEDAFRALYERHAPETLRFLRRMLGDLQAAEDALQETFVRVHRGLEGFDPERPLRPWLLTIARRSAIEALRRRARREPPISSLGSGLDPAVGAERSPAEQDETRGAVLAAVGELSPEHREVVLLRLVHGLLLEEVASAVEVTERTVRNRLKDAAVLLEQALRRRGLGPAAGGGDA